MSDESVVLTHIKYIKEKVDSIEKMLGKVADQTADQETRITIIAGQLPEIKRDAKIAAQKAGGIIGAAIASVVTAIGAIVMILWRRI